MNRSFIIAEMACSHEGSPDLARRIIRSAAQAGADAVQLQIWHLENYMSPFHPDFQKLQSLRIAPNDWIAIGRWAQQHFPQLELIACVSEAQGLQTALECGASAFKIHVSDIDNFALLEQVAQTRKRIDLSIGGCQRQEVEAALTCLRRGGAGSIWLMVGQQNFPTPPAEIDLVDLIDLNRQFGLPVGYQDHSDPNGEFAFALPAAARGLGITIHEKHITHDRALRGCDYEAALDPAPFARYVALLRTLDICLDLREAATKPSDLKLKYRRYSSKSWVARTNLERGDVLHESDLQLLRAAPPGLPGEAKSALLGRTLKQAVSAGESLTLEHLL